MPIIIQAFSDYVCPYCYLGEVVLKKVTAKTEAQVVHRAYQLRQSGLPILDPLGERMTEDWRHSIYPIAERLGLEIRQPSRLPLTRLAHESAAWARRQSAFEPFHQALFKSFFIEDQDISEMAVLKQIAFKVGLNPAELEKALNDHAMADEVDEDLLIGRTYGITAAPTLVIGGHLLSGVQSEETLMRALEAVRSGAADEERRQLPHPPVTITRK